MVGMCVAESAESVESAESDISPIQNTNVCLVRDPSFPTGLGAYIHVTREAA